MLEFVLFTIKNLLVKTPTRAPSREKNGIIEREKNI